MIKRNRHTLVALLAALLLSAWFAADAAAHGRYGSRLDFYFGTPGYWGPRYWGPGFYRPWPYYYEPPTVIIEREPPVYIQRPAPAAPTAAAAPQLWYYCPEPSGYYPYVQNCTQDWVSVDPSTVAPPPGR